MVATKVVIATATAATTSSTTAAAVTMATTIIAAKIEAKSTTADTSKMSVAKETTNSTLATTRFSIFVTKTASIITGHGTNVGFVLDQKMIMARTLIFVSSFEVCRAQQLPYSSERRERATTNECSATFQFIFKH